MRSYSEREIFDERELRLFDAVTTAVARLGYDKDTPSGALREIRCHELCRAVQSLASPELSIAVQDGQFGFVDHSWLLLTVPGRRVHSILDVYSVGRHPMVQLVTLDPGPMHGALYRPGPFRGDIDLDVVCALITQLAVGWAFAQSTRQPSCQSAET